MAPIIHATTDESAPERSRALLAEIRRATGFVPALLATAAHSPPALESLWRLHSSLAETSLGLEARIAIALRVSQLNGCAYCLAAESGAAEAAGIPAATVGRHRLGEADDRKTSALLALAGRLVADRGHHAGFEVEGARRAGATDAELVEVVQLVALGAFKNYLACLAGSVPDTAPVSLDPEEEQA